MIKKLLFFCFGLLFVNDIFSADIDDQVKTINSLELEIYIRKDYNDGYQDLSNYSNYIDYIGLKKNTIDSYSLLFFDDRKRLRKEFSYYFEQDICRQVSYYNENGDLILFYFYESNHSTFSGYGKIYFEKGKVHNFDVYSDACENAKDQGDIVKCSRLPTDEIIKINYTSKSILKKYNIGKLKSVKNNFLSRKPKVGEWTYSNSNNINIREKPDLNSKIIGNLHVLEYVKIVKVDKFQNIEPWGNNYWYKIIYFQPYYNDKQKTGYVFGAFLENVYEKK